MSKIIPIPKPPFKPASNAVTFGSIEDTETGHRVLLYGTGGIGKTTLACQAPGTVAYNDGEKSLGILKGQLSEAGIPLPVLIPGNDFKSLRAALNATGWNKIKTLVLELSKVEEWAIAHTLATVKAGLERPSSVESYGYGKGYQYVYDTFLPILADLDRHALDGRNVVLIAHDCTRSVPNPNGDDWIRYEPHLQDPSSGKASIRAKVKNWADHVLFYNYDVATDKEGKAKGSGSRRLYTSELPWFMAKSRTTNEQIEVEPGVDVWGKIIK